MISMSPSSLSRRELFVLAARAGIGAAAVAALPRAAFGGLQAGATGKHSSLIARSARPVDFETPVELLDSFITPNEAFFVRGHMTAPAVDPQTWQLSVEGDVREPRTLSVADLRALPAVSVTATIECAGNGRAFFDPPVAGIQWRKGAVGTSRWTGARLRDVVAAAGAGTGAGYVWMSGGDRPLGTQPPFVRQVPWAKAMDGDTIVAYEMDGQPIPLLHGAPLRAIVPGWEGAYSVKWLQKLTVAAREHDGFWVASGYRYPVRRVLPGATVDAKDQAPLTGLAVKSLITRPLESTVVAARTGGDCRVRLGGGVAHRARRGLDRRGRLVESGEAHRAGAQVRVAAVRTPGHASRRRAHDPLACHRRARRHPTDGAGVESVRVSLERSRSYRRDRRHVRRGGEASHRTARRILPASHPGSRTFETACRVCHDDDLSAQQRLTREGWGREVDKMIRWGARVSPDERGPLVEYLASRWGVR